MSNNGMGPSPISWVEIQAWMSATGLELSTWEVTVIKELSEAYVSELSLATDLKRPAPYTVADDSLDREEVQNKILDVFRAFKRAPVENVEE